MCILVAIQSDCWYEIHQYCASTHDQRATVSDWSLVVKWLSLLTLNQPSWVRIPAREWNYFAISLCKPARTSCGSWVWQFYCIEVVLSLVNMNQSSWGRIPARVWNLLATFSVHHHLLRVWGGELCFYKKHRQMKWLMRYAPKVHLPQANCISLGAMEMLYILIYSWHRIWFSTPNWSYTKTW